MYENVSVTFEFQMRDNYRTRKETILNLGEWEGEGGSNENYFPIEN